MEINLLSRLIDFYNIRNIFRYSSRLIFEMVDCNCVLSYEINLNIGIHGLTASHSIRDQSKLVTYKLMTHTYVVEKIQNARASRILSYS